MPNSAFLLNTPTRVSDISAIRGQWLVVAEVPYRIPLAWLCMFDATDLRPSTLTFSNPQIINGEQRYLLGKYAFLNPSTSVKDARERLARSRPVFEILAGNAEIGTQYWREAMAALDTLPLGFLTIDATEVLLLDDVKTSTEALAEAVGFGAPSMEAKQRLARFNPHVGVELNQAALSAAILPADAFQRWERSPEEARAWLDLLARLDTCNLVQTDTGYDAIPLARPPEPTPIVTAVAPQPEPAPAFPREIRQEIPPPAPPVPEPATRIPPPPPVPPLAPRVERPAPIAAPRPPVQPVPQAPAMVPAASSPTMPVAAVVSLPDPEPVREPLVRGAAAEAMLPFAGTGAPPAAPGLQAAERLAGAVETAPAELELDLDIPDMASAPEPEAVAAAVPVDIPPVPVAPEPPAAEAKEEETKEEKVDAPVLPEAVVAAAAQEAVASVVEPAGAVLPAIDPASALPVARAEPVADALQASAVGSGPALPPEEPIATHLLLPDIELTFPQGSGPDANDMAPQPAMPVVEAAVVEPAMAEPEVLEAGALPAIELTMPAVEPAGVSELAPEPPSAPEAEPVGIAAPLAVEMQVVATGEMPVEDTPPQESHADIETVPAETVEIVAVPAMDDAQVEKPEDDAVGVTTLVELPSRPDPSIDEESGAAPSPEPEVSAPAPIAAPVAETPKAPAPHPARPWMAPWEHLPAGQHEVILQNIEDCRQLARTLLQRELDFNEDAVHWLDEMAEFMHKTGAKTDNLGPVHVLASFLGECVRRRFGGEWALYKGDLCIRYNQENGAFPVSRVIRQIEQGRFGGDSITALYEEQKALLGHELTPLQRRFSGLFKVRPHFRYFVRVRRGNKQAWAKVRDIDGAWVYLETQPAPGQEFPPEISVRLCELAEFNVVDTNGVKVKLGGAAK